MLGWNHPGFAGSSVSSKCSKYISKAEQVIFYSILQRELKLTICLCFFTGILQGFPGPESERNAIDVVIQYAVEKLGFPVSKIIIYAWSIGECSNSCYKYLFLSSVHIHVCRLSQNIMSSRFLSHDR